MAFYFFYQSSEKESWQIALDSDRERIINEVKPFLTSVLACDFDFKEQLSNEEMAKVKYIGPLYADFDCAEGATVIDVAESVKEFLGKLKAKGVDLDSLRIYASGGKGFHVEIPLETVKEKVPRTGIAGLPYIIKELMYELAVDFLDFRVYSGKRGRLWRTPNVLRSNGRYKVPITFAELETLQTVEDYEAITSAPRRLPRIAPPEFNPTLAVLFQMSEDKVTTALKKRKNSKVDASLVRKFNGEWPETVKHILSGNDLAEGVGFQRIAMQLAIAAHALGKSEKDFIRDSDGLCEKHQSDGVRYNTFRKRMNELSRMYRYLDNNTCYTFEPGPLKALLKPEVDTSDLTGGGYTPDPEDDGADAGANLESDADDISRAIRINRTGFFVKDDLGFRKVSDVGISKPMQLIKIDDSKVIGYEVSVFIEDQSRGTHALTMHTLQTKARFMEWASGIGSASIQASDAQVSMIMDALRKRSEKNGDKVWIVSREGIDIVCPYGMDYRTESDIIWASRDGVLSGKGRQYRLRGRLQGGSTLKTDLQYAPDLLDTPETRATMRALFNLNSRTNMALLLGWFLASFISQIIRSGTGQYPSLQVWGERGAGKSTLIKDLLWLHTFSNEIELLNVNGTTDFALRSNVASSASVPVPIDEVKPREMGMQKRALVRDLLRNNYSGAVMKRGNVNKDSGESNLELIEDKNEAPIIFIGEALETESAMMERCVIVSMSKGTRENCEESQIIVSDNHRHISSFGRLCMQHVLGGVEVVSHYVKDVDARDDQPEVGHVVNEKSLTNGVNQDAIVKSIRRNATEVRTRLGSLGAGQDRPIHNIAVALTGLELGQYVARSVFGNEFDSEFDDMRQAMLGRTADVVPESISEAAKVIDVMAQMSYGTGDEMTNMHFGKDYTVSSDGATVDIALKTSYNKYVMHVRRLGQQPLYDTFQAFYAAMKNYGATIASSCPDNPALYKNPMSVVFRFNVMLLEKEKVEPFRNV